MGKVKSDTSKRARHDPLTIQLREDERGGGKLSAPGRRAGKRKEDAQENVLTAKTSKRVLDLARQQQEEELESDDDDEEGSDAELQLNPQLVARQQANGAIDSDEEDDADRDLEGFDEEGDDVYEDLEIDEGDQAILDSFAAGGSRNLADMIMAKLDEHQAAQSDPSSKGKAPLRDLSPDPASSLNPKVVEVYTKVGHLLSRYKSGPLPKAFKILPSLRNWVQLLDLTQPENWTPHATYAATRIFASNLDPKQSQKFFRGILYERAREEIEEEKKLSVQLYMALKKALYKPAAFFKGILFPLCESGTCTLREAAIVGSVISKVSIPVLHSGAALLKLAEMDYTGPTSLFIRVLLDKKYALPYKVVDALVFHFIRFKRDTRVMPVLWHQSFLVFAQRYKADLTQEQKEALLDVIKVKSHPGISPEIRRELVHSVARGEEIVPMEAVEILS